MRQAATLKCCKIREYSEIALKHHVLLLWSLKSPNYPKEIQSISQKCHQSSSKLVAKTFKEAQNS
jgi:hypothetical protein